MLPISELKKKNKSLLSVIKPSLNTFCDILVVEDLSFYDTQLVEEIVSAKDI